MRLAVTTPFRPTPEALSAARDAALRRALPFQPRATRSLDEVAADAGADALLVLGGFASLWVAGAEQRWHPGMGGLRAKRFLAGERITGDSFLEAARLRPGDAVLDCTLGLGADALVAAAAVGPGGRVVGLEGSPAAGRLGRRGVRPPPRRGRRPASRSIAADHATWLRSPPDRAASTWWSSTRCSATPARRRRGFDLLRRLGRRPPAPPGGGRPGPRGWRGAACW